MTVQLTDGIVAQLVCLEGQTHREVFDTHIKGLYVDVQPSGRMSWRLRWYEKKAGKYPKRVMTLGDARVLTVDEARGAAREVLRRLWAGTDPTTQVLPGVSARRKGRPRRSTRAWMLGYARLRPRRPTTARDANGLGSRPPFCAAGAPVRFHKAAVDRAG